MDDDLADNSNESTVNRKRRKLIVIRVHLLEQYIHSAVSFRGIFPLCTVILRLSSFYSGKTSKNFVREVVTKQTKSNRKMFSTDQWTLRFLQRELWPKRTTCFYLPQIVDYTPIVFP